MRATPACLLAAAAALALGACALETESRKAPPPPDPLIAACKADPTMEQDAEALYATLDVQQRAKALLPFEDRRRQEIIFPGGPRAGIQIGDLNEQQRQLAHKLIADFTSPAGMALAEHIISQGDGRGLKRYYLAYFGEPVASKPHAWRIVEHHLTLVDVEIDVAQDVSVGPVLLGSNPPDFFEVEEDDLLQMHAALTPEDRQLVDQPGAGISGEPLQLAASAPVWKLSAGTRAKLAALIDLRLAFYSPAMQQRIRAILDSRGGLNAMHMAYYGKVDKRSKEGGRWDWKLGGTTCLIDYENSRGHIHTSLQAAVQRPTDPQ